MGANSVTFELRAEDLGATATAERVGGSVRGQAAAVNQSTAATDKHTTAAGQAERQQRRLANAIAGSTSVAGLAASAVSNLRGILLSLPMGAVAGATAALTAVLIEQIVKWLDLETAASRAQKTLDRIGQTTAQAVAPALLPIQTRIEEINKQLGNINARTPAAAAAIRSRLEDELRHLTRLRDTILGPKPTEQEIGIGANQEAIGRRIQQQAKWEWEARNTTQEEMGRRIQAQAKLEYEGRLGIQEQMGQQIAAAARRQWEAEQGIQEARGASIAAAALFEYEERLKTEDLKIQAIQNGAAAAMNIANALSVFSQGKSRSLFQVAKAAAIAQATVDTYAAANAALKGPPGPPWSYAIAAAAVAAGLANVARISSTQFGGSGGGGASIPSGSPSIVSSVPPGARDITPGRPINVEIHFNSTVTDRASVEAFFSDNIGLVGQIIKERSGQAGPVRLTYET